MSAIRLDRIDSLAALEGIKGAWLDIERTDCEATLFQSWTWNLAWCQQVLAQRQGTRLAVRVARDAAGRILAILPFFEQDLVGSAIRVMRFVGHGISNYGGILSADPGNRELMAFVVASLLRDLGPRTIVHLTHLNGESPFTRQLLAKHLAEPQCPRIWLEADRSGEDPSARLGPKMRKNLRSIRNHMQRKFKIEFRAVSGPDFPLAFDEFADLHQRRFAAVKKASSLVGSNLVFLKVVTAELSNKGQCEIIQLRADRVTIAAQLMMRDRDRYYAIQGGFAPQFGRFSPGFLLDLEAIRRGFNELGCTIYEFGAGYEAYKYHWNPVIGTSYFCTAGAQNIYARSAAALYRTAFLQSLPPLPKDLPWRRAAAQSDVACVSKRIQ